MFIVDMITAFADWAWGVPMIIWLVGGGIVLTIAIGGIQFTKLGFVLKHTVIKSIREKKDGEGISGLQAVLSAMSGTIGSGNIVGVGAAIALGGPGAVLWMWIVGLVAMAIKYSEALSAVKFRKPASGAGGYLWDAGPAFYLKLGVPYKKVGLVLGTIFGYTIITNLSVSACEHTASIADVLTSAFGLNRVLVVGVCVAIVAAVMLGGMKRFVRVSEMVVPIMSILYIAFGLIIICKNITVVPEVFAMIFKGAFGGTAAVGGFAGAGVSQAIRWGTARGMYSNDAGTGLQAIMHGQADVKHPAQQGLFGIFEVFFDTIVICSFTALIILTTGVWESGAEGSQLTLMAFTQEFGMLGTIVESACLCLFAITTAIGMAMFQERHLTAFFNKTVARIFDVLYLILMVVGGLAGFDAILPFTDTTSAINIFINMTGLLLMARGIRATTKDYFENFIKQEENA